MFNFLERFHYATEAVLCISQKLEKTFQFKFPLAILLRNIVSDYLTVMYFLSFIEYQNNGDGTLKPLDEKYLEESHRIDRSFFRVVENDLDDLIMERKITQARRQERMQELQKQCPAQFEIDANGDLKFKHRKELSPKQLAKHLKGQPGFEGCYEAYEFYKYYSQYEHISRMSKTMLYSDLDAIDIPCYIGTIRHMFGATCHIMANMGIDQTYFQRMVQLLEDMRHALPKDKK